MKEWLSKQFEWVKTFLSAADGKGSFRRLGSLMILALFCRSYFVASFYSKTIPDVPEMWAILIATILGFSVAEAFKKDKQ